VVVGNQSAPIVRNPGREYPRLAGMKKGGILSLIGPKGGSVDGGKGLRRITMFRGGKKDISDARKSRLTNKRKTVSHE